MSSTKHYEIIVVLLHHLTSTISSRVLQVYLEKSITLSHTHDRDPNAGVGVKVGVVVYEGLPSLSPGRVQD